MPEQLLDGAQIDPGHDEVACESVPEVVPAKLGDGGLRASTTEGGVDGGAADGVAPWPGKHPLAVAGQGVDDGADVAVEGNVPLLVVLGELDREQPDREVDVTPAEGELLTLSEPRVEGEDDRGLEPERDVASGSTKKPLDFIGGEIAKAGIVFGKIADVAGGAPIEELPSDSLGENGLEQCQLAVDSARGNLRSALGLPTFDAPRGQIRDGR